MLPPLWSEPWYARAPFAALATNYPRSTREEYVCRPIGAIETGVGWPQCVAAHGKQRGVTVVRPPFRCEVYRMKLGRRHAYGYALLKDITSDHSRAGFRYVAYEPLRLAGRIHRRHGEPPGRPS
jgi:hypothetical protein